MTATCTHVTLLSSNAKLEKSKKLGGIVTAGLALAPHKRSGRNMCPGAGFCSRTCNLWFSGRCVTQSVRNAMLNRAYLLIREPHEFRRQLERELAALERKAAREGATAFVRLNVSSDLDFSDVAVRFPGIRFYDYTKVRSRVERMISGNWPANYWLTPSYHERLHWNTVRRYLRHGLNVSVIFDTVYQPQAHRIGPLPESYRGVPVIDGDTHDLRVPEYDGCGVIVGLRFKGSRRPLGDAIRVGLVIAT